MSNTQLTLATRVRALLVSSVTIAHGVFAMIAGFLIFISGTATGDYVAGALMFGAAFVIAHYGRKLYIRLLGA